MAKQFFKNLPDTTTPLEAGRLNGLLDGEEALGNLVVDSIRSKNMFDGVLLNGVYNDTTGIFTPSVSLCSKKIKIKSSTSYYLSGVTGSVRVHYWNNGTYVGNEVITAPNSFVSQGNITAFQFGGSTPHSNIQLEIGSSATTYTPYQELNPDNFKNEEIVVGSIRSKNIYNPSAMPLQNGLWQSGGKISSNGAGNYVVIPIKGGVTYSISRKYDNTTTGIQFLIGTTANYPVVNETLLSYQNASTDKQYTFTTPSNAKYLWLGLLGSGSPTEQQKAQAIDELQIEINSTSSNYMPYQDLTGLSTSVNLLDDTTPSANTSYTLNDSIFNYKYILIVMTSANTFANSSREYIPVSQLLTDYNYRVALSVFQSTSVYMFLDLYFDAYNSIKCNGMTKGTTGWTPHIKVYGIK